jgi:OTU domain-containing protein 3
VIEYMREHAVYFKQFMEVLPGGGQRRNPKRKNAGVYSTPTTFTPPTQEEVDRVFETHLGSMARGGTYGDNMEITAFAAVYKVDVKIYQVDFAYMIPAPEDGTVHPVAHIAYHVRIIESSSLITFH